MLIPRHVALAKHLRAYEAMRQHYWQTQGRTSYIDALERYMTIGEIQNAKTQQSNFLVHAASQYAKNKQSELIDSIPETPPMTPDEMKEISDKVEAYHEIVEECERILNASHISIS